MEGAIVSLSIRQENSLSLHLVHFWKSQPSGIVEIEGEAAESDMQHQIVGRSCIEGSEGGQWVGRRTRRNRGALGVGSAARNKVSP